MADEENKVEKQAFIINKKAKIPLPSTQNVPSTVKKEGEQALHKKKKIVVRRKAQALDTHKASATQTATTASENKTEVSEKNVSTSAINKGEVSKNQTKSSSFHTQKQAIRYQEFKEKKAAKLQEGLKKPMVATELKSARPNIKAGNLSDRPRYVKRRRDDDNFTGTQAREGYRNRQQQGRGGFNSRNASANAQGGVQQRRSGSFSNNRAGFGGQNRGNFANSRGGFGANRSFNQSIPPVATVPKSKKQYKAKKPIYNKKDKEEAFEEDKFFGQKKKHEVSQNSVPATIDIMETISVSDLAKKMNLKASEIIAKLMSMGMMVTITQSIDSDTAAIVASEYHCDVHLVSLYDETVIESDKAKDEEKTRPPIVTVMGHVDHGKTKTLDAIRNTNVAMGEAGGITQHIGAYQVHTPKGDITFLDTPGHEAFTMMRARGAQITDIVVLVVAADDGVMPQTKEAINHARDANVPIIVAVNKIDKPDANPDRVRTQLSELGLTPEDWGGDTQYVNICALKRQGIDELLDAILLQAEVLELKAQWNVRAEGKILESRTDQGRGVVSTVVVQKGTLHTGDPYVAGIYSGRVRAMFDDHGNRVEEAFPSMPVEVLGMEAMPNAGDPFQVTDSEKSARLVSAKRQELKRFEAAKAVKKVTLDNLFQTIDAGEVQELKVIIKADVQGSAEALKQSLEKLSTAEIRLNVIHSSAGAINESDVTLATADSNAIIIGFNVRPTPKAKALAEQEKVDIRKYNVIYKCVEEITQAMEGMLKPDTKEVAVGTLEVRNTFRVPKVGVIAGCYVTDGVVKRNCYVNVVREGIVKHTGKISSLKHFKDDVKEMAQGFECGVGIEDWQDIVTGDTLEVFDYVQIARKLGDNLIDEKARDEAEQQKRDSQNQKEKGATSTPNVKAKKPSIKSDSHIMTPEEIAMSAVKNDEGAK